MEHLSHLQCCRSLGEGQNRTPSPTQHYERHADTNRSLGYIVSSAFIYARLHRCIECQYSLGEANNHKVLRNTHTPQAKVAQNTAHLAHNSILIDADLRSIIEAWSKLSDSVRAGIVAMARAAGG